MVDQIIFPEKWVDSLAFENTLRSGIRPHETNTYKIKFVFPVNCKIKVDAIVRLLSLLNQLEYCTKQIELEFLEGEYGVMGYLDRLGFFDFLSKK